MLDANKQLTALASDLFGADATWDVRSLKGYVCDYHPPTPCVVATTLCMDVCKNGCVDA